MFGYVTVDRPNMRIKEYDYYRATYCGLCHSMGKCTGCLSRMTLSYDVTFFALMREAIADTPVELEKKRCIRHPFRARQTVKYNDQLEFSAFVGGLLSANKIRDNINDESGIKRLIARLGLGVFSGMERRSRAFSAELDERVGEILERLSEVEKKRTCSVDIPADLFGELCALMLSWDFEGEKRKIALEIGKRVGRWIYMVDAIDDYARDRESGSYNPFVELYGGADFDEQNLISITYMLEGELAMAESAFDLLNTDSDVCRREILKNILCLGMPGRVKKILYCKKNGEKR